MLSDARPWAMALALLIATVTFVAVAPVSAETLEVFAGQDKLVRVNVETVFNDGELVRPNPPSPDRTYRFAWDFDNRRDLDLDSVYDNDNESGYMLTSHRFTSPGEYLCTLTVTNDLGDTAKDTCVVTAVVDELPAAHIKSVSPNQTTEGGDVVFVGEGTDPDGTIEGYSWRSDRDGVLSGNATFNTTSLSVGVHTITFKVLDDKGYWSEPVTATIEVLTRPNEPPTLVVLTNITRADTGTEVEFRVRYTDAEGDAPVFHRVNYGRIVPLHQRVVLEVDGHDLDYTDGKDYLFKTELKVPGNYTFYFEFKDAKNLTVKSEERYIDVREVDDSTPGWGPFTMVSALLLAVGIRSGAFSRRCDRYHDI